MFLYNCYICDKLSDKPLCPPCSWMLNMDYADDITLFVALKDPNQVAMSNDIYLARVAIKKILFGEKCYAVPKGWLKQ